MMGQQTPDRAGLFDEFHSPSARQRSEKATSMPRKIGFSK
jgi:hypothetical protein